MLPKVVHSTLPFFVHCKFASYIKFILEHLLDTSLV